MFHRAMRYCVPIVALMAWPIAAPAADKVSFNRDIRPILADRCFACHGPDGNKREADLRLDRPDSAVGNDGQERAIIAGNPDASELMQRITSEDADERMPPVDFGKPLSQEQIELLRRWIEQGAGYETHWSLVPLTRPAVPQDTTTGATPVSSPHPIDAFIARKLHAAGLSPSRPAAPRTLARRLAFDLTGLPPTAEQVAALERTPSDEVYRQLVDELLASPRYGERMAVYWLDLVRYADTLGFHGDQDRSVSPYRDYVIEAFNANMPFDQFTIEQLAGDLLPNATLWQKVASTYNRLNRASAEGGVQPKEYLAKYAADRVRTTGQVWLGATFGCAECHDHKFDAYTMKDFYSFAAFFADIREQGIVPGAVHLAQLPVPTPEQSKRLQQLTGQLKSAQQSYDEQAAALAEKRLQWEKGLLEAAQQDKKLAQAARVAPDKRTPEQKKALDKAFAALHPRLQEAYAALKRLETEKQKLEQSIVTTLATEATKPRVMRVLPRGNWMDDSGEVVEPAVPHFLPQPQAAGTRRLNRLDLAQWLVSEASPLVARTFVNRLWMLFFGEGLSRSVDDLGAQGEPPSHPELLDWLAYEFVASGWDVKHLVKLIVTSQTYRQSSRPRAELEAVDPYNRLLARQGRWRLEAEMVRDQALQVSGLLVEVIGGRSVKPYQPAGYWAQLNFPKRKYQHDSGPNQYRRGLYTHWQRTFLHPSLLAFDAPVREECTARRARSNTPLQALVLLNDPTYVEAARVLAGRLLLEGPAEPEQRVDWLYLRVLQRLPNARERSLLIGLVAKQKPVYERSTEAARELTSVGLAPVPEGIDVAELAAWTAAARAMLNLHETITRY